MSAESKLARVGWRTHAAGELRGDHAGQSVVLGGWVQGRRDHGGLIFLDLRDRSGLVQVVVDPAVSGEELFELAKSLRNEYVIRVEGTVRRRDESLVNPELASGEIEVVPSQLELLSEAETPPLQIERDSSADEVNRLTHRVIDLRRPDMQERLILRHQVTKFTRDFFAARGFLEIETPVLTKSTPEGARDFLVPSRMHPGEFYALPQSPQLFKQMLMMAGYERYLQVVRCFRDEDLRADRQPEFTQVDIEMSFVDEGDIRQLMEVYMQQLFESVLGVQVELPLPLLTYAEAMNSYGSDKPDLRFELPLADATAVFSESEFRVFRSVVEDGGAIKVLRVEGGAGYSRREIDELEAVATGAGAHGLAWFKLNKNFSAGSDDLQDLVHSPIAKFLSTAEIRGLAEAAGGGAGDLLLLVAGDWQLACEALGQVRLDVAQREQLLEPGWRFAWVVDFPLLEWSEREQRWTAMHHPFTQPREEDLSRLQSEPGAVRAHAYDLVLNGSEIGGGSLRIHRQDMQEQVFGALGIGADEAQEKFGFLLESLRYGTPPHGGIAFGLDRLVALMSGASSLRDVIAFPKTARGRDLLVQAPAPVPLAQLEELGLKVTSD